LSASITQVRPTPWKGRQRKTVEFDSSFLVAVMEAPTPWEEDIAGLVGAFDPVLLTSVRSELERLASKGDKKGKFAALALELVAEGRFKVEPDAGGKPDDEIISFALRTAAAVATIDSELVERLRASKVSSVITLRQGRVSF